MKKSWFQSLAFGLTIGGALLLSSCGGQSGTETPATTEGEQATEQPAEPVEQVAEAGTNLAAGKIIYERSCQMCHQANGEGIAGTFPPLAKSDYLLADKARAIVQTVNGSDVPITVNGTEYPGGTMVLTQPLTNEEVRDVVNYILNSWGNDGGTVTLEEVELALAKK